MKFIYILFVALLFSACSNQSASEATDAQETLVDSIGTKLNIDQANSNLTWSGSSLSKQHNGTISIQSGEITLKNDLISSANFTIDMTSIKNIDLVDETKNSSLVGHLNDTDFFNTKVFPTGLFEITGVEVLTKDSMGNTHLFSGNLVLKGISKNISFPAKVEMTDNDIKVNGSVVLDRTNWGITYKSITAFPNLKAKLKDNAINDNFTVGINIVAKK